MGTLRGKLLTIQSELNVKKTRKNNFGNFSYRNAEDILNAVKPLLKENGVMLHITDSVELIGDRFYIKAIATVFDIESDENISSSGYAREELHKPKMDDSQATGSASSYARKYALNGLFCIDDGNDSDTTNDGSPESLQSEESRIVDSIQKASTKSELIKVWNDNKHLQARPDVLEAMKNACSKFHDKK